MVSEPPRRQYSMTLQRSMARIEYNDQQINDHGWIYESHSDLIDTW